ncbi:hypothetical protein T479_13390 [Lysinibacillus varians]|nr:hypothetical protein T479_13390 [Lysinibacillus varians]
MEHGLSLLKAKKIRVEPFAGSADFFICAIVEDEMLIS